MGKLPFAVGSENGLQIINRIAPFVAGGAVADLEIHDRGVGSIYQLMPWAGNPAHIPGESFSSCLSVTSVGSPCKM